LIKAMSGQLLSINTFRASRGNLCVSIKHKTMKILLILPAGDRVRVTRANLRVPKRAMLRFSVLPLTIVAALTPRAHEVRIVDENVEPLDYEAECDLVGITFMTALAPRAYEIAREFRARGKVVVGGGYHATLCPDDAVKHFDAIVAGDAEGVWERVLADVETGRLGCRGGSVDRGQMLNGDWVFSESTSPRGTIYRSENHSPELRTPVPRRELLTATARHYVTVNAVQTGRGCPHACRYCSVTVFHDRSYRHRPLAHVLAELQQVSRDFIFVDDNIIADRTYARELFTAMVPLRKRWVSQSSIDIADDADLLRWRTRRVVVACLLASRRPVRRIWRPWANNSTRAGNTQNGWRRSGARGLGLWPGLSWEWMAMTWGCLSTHCAFLDKHGLTPCN
jgi:hypothetical protein